MADVARVVPRRHRRDIRDAGGLDIAAGLRRWAGRLTRRRAVALTQRYLLVALVIALVPAVVILAAGASRPFWVFGFLVLAPLAGAAALAQRTSEPRAAQLLDRQLGLHEQLGTAYELQADPNPASGLARLVVEEARVSLAGSLATTQVRIRRAPAEWAWTAAALCALVVVIALPRHSAVNRVANGRSALAGAPRGSASGQPRQNAPAKSAPSHTTPLSTHGTTSTPAVQQVPLAGGARAAYGVQASTTPGGHPPAYVNGSGTVQGQHTKPGLAVSGGKGAGGTQSAGSRASAGAGGTTTGTSGSTAQAGRPGDGSTAKASSGAQGARSAVTSTTPGKTAGAASGSQKGVNSGGTPAGGTAGTGKAAAHSQLGLQPYGGSGSGKKTLPLQANYTPAGTSHASATEGVSTTDSGNGNGVGQSAQAGAGTAGSGQPDTNFSVLPPTSNASPSSDQDLLDNYFGSANQLTFKGW